MNADDTRRSEMIVRSSALAQENHAIIERAADGAAMITNLGAVVTTLQGAFTAAESATREGHGTTSNRREARNGARRTLGSIRQFAVSLGTTGLNEKFQVPKTCSDPRLTAIVRGVIVQATPLAADLVARGMPKTALDDLASHGQAIDDAIHQQNVAKEARVAARVGIRGGFTIAMGILKRIDAIMTTADDPAALAKWKTARRPGPRRTADAATAAAPPVPESGVPASPNATHAT